MKAVRTMLLGVFLCLSQYTQATDWFVSPVLEIPLQQNLNALVVISSKNEMSVATNAPSKKKYRTSSLFLSVKGQQVYLNGKMVETGTFYLYPYNQRITINNHTYKGPATISITREKIKITAHRELFDFFNLVWNKKQEHAPQTYTVNVLIDELVSAHAARSWMMSSNAGFVLYNPERPDQKWDYSKEYVEISFKRASLYINNKRCIYSNLRIIPKDGYASINGQPYHGTFSVIPKDERQLLINHVDLEEYVYAVLRTESWPGWPVEVNKVFAIISRSYVMAMINQTKTSTLPYHVKNTNEHQTYQGMHTNGTIRAAIEQTRGMFLMHENKPALAMFDACCGGIIPAGIAEFEFKKAPYLARNYACEHCKRCKIYSWKAEFDASYFHKQLNHLFDASDTIDTVQITKKDPAGLVQELMLQNKAASQTISGKQLYSALKEIKSFCFTVQKQAKIFILHGKGFGHHLGLCQWGAREMVRDGWNFRKILSFYYPGTQVVRLI